jgi:DNA-binding MarR family transcriptional regulator
MTRTKSPDSRRSKAAALPPAAALQSWQASPAALHLDAQFCFPLYAAAHVVARAYRPLLEPLGLTYPQYLVMLVLWEEQTVTVKALGERLHLDSGTLSPLLARLSTARLVKKQRDKDDARKVAITLTAKGLALRDDAAGVPEALVCEILGKAAGKDVDDASARAAALRTQLQGLLRAFGETAA